MTKQIPVTGTSILRQALRARGKAGSLAAVARNLQVSAETLSEFVRGGAPPSALVLQALAIELWGGVVAFDPEIDRLRGARPGAELPTPVRPDPIKPRTDHLREHQRLQVAPGMPSQIAPKSRPGWAK